jgi:hypothetical protein
VTAPTRRTGEPRKTGHQVKFHDDTPRQGRREWADDTVRPVLLTDFDVTDYSLEVEGLIDVDADALTADLRDAPAGTVDIPALRRDLGYLRRIESATLTEVRTMYSSWTANEARITSFLVSYLWDRFWWARALRDVCEALPASGAGTTTEAGRATEAGDAEKTRRPTLRARLRHTYVERLLPIVGPGWNAAVGEAVTAGHMARMAIQDASMLAALRAMLPRVPAGGELRRILSTIIGRRERTVDFFRTEATARITRSVAEARTARAVLTVGGDPLRPAGDWVPGETEARASIFRTATSRAALRRAHEEITRLLPGPTITTLSGPRLPKASRVAAIEAEEAERARAAEAMERAHARQAAGRAHAGETSDGPPARQREPALIPDDHDGGDHGVRH